MRFTATIPLLLLVSSISAKERHYDLDDISLKWAESRTDEATFVAGEDWGATTHAYVRHGNRGHKGSNGHRPPKRPDCETPKQLDTCELTGEKDTCDLHSSCTPSCVPAFCKLPNYNPHKIHGWEHPSDRYVKLGSICGYMHYVQGEAHGRHELEVCCVVDDALVPTSLLDDDEHGKCIGCEACAIPQKVNDACCKIAHGGEDGRNGNFALKCPGGDCCKCAPGNGPGSYVCIPKGAPCTESLCPAPPTTDGPVTTVTTTTSDSISSATETPSTTDSDTSTTTPFVTTEDVTGTTGEGTSTTTTTATGTADVPVATSASTTSSTTAESLSSTTTSTTTTTSSTTPDNPIPTGQYGLQPSCAFNIQGEFNICLDLTSISGQYEANWMDDVIAAAADWEQYITGDLPSVNTTGLGLGRPNPPNLTQSCTAYPEVIDDLYVCAQDVDLGTPSGTLSTVAFAGPFLFRAISEGDGAFVLPYAARIGMSQASVDNPGLRRTMLHEFAHALGFPFLQEDRGLISNALYANETNADQAWKRLGCSGQIPMQSDLGHWDEGCLNEELMTPVRVTPGGTPLSQMTLGAMEDIGYQVNLSLADAFSINDLGNCGSSCPGTPTGSGGRKLRRLLGLPEEVKMAFVNEFKDDLIYFRDQLETTGFVRGEGGHYALEKIYLLVSDEGGQHHTVSISYDDVMGL